MIDVLRFLEVMKSRYGNGIIVVSDQEDKLINMVRPMALKLGLTYSTSPVERPQANGRAENRGRAIKERLQISVSELRRQKIEILKSAVLTS